MTGNKTILGGILTICLVAGIIGASYTGAFFSDTETSTGNTFEAGTIDLTIDLQCEGSHGENCGWAELRNLHGETFFNECDIKPGDTGEVTVSLHIEDNKAWGKISLADLYDYENGCSEPEEKYPDPTCNSDPNGIYGELSQYLTFTLWMDEGNVKGWQCPGNGPCNDDLMEGDNIFNGAYEVKIADNMPAIDLVNGIKLRDMSGNLLELQPSTTYYVGMQWEVPYSTGNIIQTDSLTGKIIMEVVQSRNNPTPWTP